MLYRLVTLLLFISTSVYADPLTMKEVAEGVFIHQGAHEELDEGYHGDIANIGFVVGNDAVAVIDTGGSKQVGDRLREAIVKVTALPIRFVINTHIHPDHVFGNASFVQDKPEFIGHAKLGDAMELRRDIYIKNNTDVLGAAFAGSALIKPTKAVSDTLEIDLGGRNLQLKAWSTAHTNTDLTVFDEGSSTLWTGDLLFVERTPAMDGDTRNWLKLIPQLKAIPAKLAVPGHGTATPQWQAAFDKEQHYFEVVLADIRANIAKGVTMEKTMDSAATSEKGNWVLFNSVNRRNINLLYPQLEWE
ncbi:MAG: quinoprotein relay system zinc metallohydrolase 2 [Methylophilales bacterium]|nr:quinoprotein relay system zinc metallohydrolase 2 [Methylophilales bacterium]